MKPRSLLRMWLLTLSCVSLHGQPTGTIVPGAPTGPPPSELTAEDAVKFEFEAGTLVLTLATGPDGRAYTQRFSLTDQVSPELILTVEPAAAGRFRYRYTLGNRTGARDRIHLFAVGVRQPDELTSISQPPTWRPADLSIFTPEQAARAAWGAVNRINWWAWGAGLEPGSVAGPFSLESVWLPGLTTAYVSSNVWPEAPKIPLLPKVEDALYKYLSIENNSVRPVTIGPKIASGPAVSRSDVLKGISSELRQAARLAEFQGLSETLLALANKIDDGEYSPQMFANLGKTQFHRAFFEAMQMDLKYATDSP